MKIGDSNKKTKIVDLNQATQPETQIPVDFENDDLLNAEISEPTLEAKDNDRNTNNKEKITLEQAQQNLAEMESSAKERFDYGQLQDTAAMLIDLIDTFICTVLRFWSGNTAPTAYEIPKPKKEMLAKNLTLILVKYQSKFSIEFMFILTLAIVYSVPVMKAREFKKLNPKINKIDPNLPNPEEAAPTKPVKPPKPNKFSDAKKPDEEVELTVAEEVTHENTPVVVEPVQREVRKPVKIRKVGGQNKY